MGKSHIELLAQILDTDTLETVEENVADYINDCEFYGFKYESEASNMLKKLVKVRKLRKGGK